MAFSTRYMFTLEHTLTLGILHDTIIVSEGM